MQGEFAYLDRISTTSSGLQEFAVAENLHLENIFHSGLEVWLQLNS